MDTKPCNLDTLRALFAQQQSNMGPFLRNSNEICFILKSAIKFSNVFLSFVLVLLLTQYVNPVSFDTDHDLPNQLPITATTVGQPVDCSRPLHIYVAIDTILTLTYQTSCP